MVSVFTRVALLLLVLAGLVGASGCSAVEGVFKAGLWTGVIMVVLVVGGLALVVSRFR